MTEYTYTIITPIHVGSGEKLGSWDFVIQKNQCIVIDLESILTHLKDNSSALNELGGANLHIDKVLEKYKLSATSVQKYVIPISGNIKYLNQILEMIKTGMGNSLLPGSSIKGAIRTVLLWHLVKTIPVQEISNIYKKIIMDRKRKKEQADKELDQLLFGHDPNHDFMRGLHVGDVEFKISALCLADTRVLSLKDFNNYGWKKMGKSAPNVSNSADATSIHVEALQTGSVSKGKIKLDEFLFVNPDAIKELKFSDKKDLLDNFPERCNQYALNFISNEIEFFKSCGMTDLVNFYEDLRSEISQSDGAFFLHLGWGSGWRGMTGNCLEEDDLRNLRSRFLMGKKGFPIFPKTRKIAFENGLPRYPMGWIKIQKTETKPGRPETSTNITTSEPAPVVQSELMRNFEEFRLSPSPEHFKTFIEKIKPDNIEELGSLPFEKMRGIMNIGFVSPLIQCEKSHEIKNLLAHKLLDVIEKSKKWKDDKLDKYNKLKAMAE